MATQKINFKRVLILVLSMTVLGLLVFWDYQILSRDFFTTRSFLRKAWIESIEQNSILIINFKDQDIILSDFKTKKVIRSIYVFSLQKIHYDTKLGSNMIVYNKGPTNDYNIRIHGGEIILKSLLGFKKYIHVNCTGLAREGKYPVEGERMNEVGVIETVKGLIGFLNNASIGAFIGAFSAFFLVVINDLRRDRKKVDTITKQIEQSAILAMNKIEMVKTMRTELQIKGLVYPGPAMKFNTLIIRQLSIQVAHKLNHYQQLAIDSICYTMDSVDWLLDSNLEISQRFSKMDEPEQQESTETLTINFSDAISNLNRLKEMSNNYSKGLFEEIVTKKYFTKDYRE